MLAGTKQLPRAANFEVAHGNAKARAQLVAAFKQGFQTAPGIEGQGGMPIIEEIAVASDRAAAHPPPQLIKLSQSEVVGPVNDDRIGPAYVQPILDNRCANENIDFSVRKTDHRVLQLALGHLAVGDGHYRLRNLSLKS